ncbi:fused MFS/spermidine synthase [Yoonia sp.]|uniref:fused MFS/spermidine synthase n=1 Tax=Yoonia sp. TaxID=2212373 RepID=UPI0025CBAC0E|nr:fused MFS/spermidine synthase [Yoonia sp.]
MTTAINTAIRRRRIPRLVPVLFTATIFLSASLLFFVQPLFTKIVLPYIGGAPAVWTTAMLFFQTILIAGYLYAHLSTKYLPVSAQVGLHLLLWAMALIFLPLSIQSGWQFDPDTPVALQTLSLFALGVGMPFAVLSANAPLIQSWYAKSDGPSADDPYFLYGASNLGSLSALLAFPLVAEPLFGATQIGWGWAAGFVALGGFLALSGLATRKGHAAVTSSAPLAENPTPRDYAWWLLLAFIPSSLMLSVTSTISTDIGSFPLVWVLPLSLYLLTFVLCFTNRPWVGAKLLNGVFVLSLAIFAMVLTGVKLGSVTIPLTVALLLSFLVIAMKAHQTLYDARPAQNNLTIFYVTMSVGGALGGLFNAILAPNLFADLHEARITVILAATLLFVGTGRLRLGDLGKGVLAAALIIAPVAAYGVLPGDLGIETLVGVMGAVFITTLVMARHKPLIGFIATLAVLGIGGQLTRGQSVFKDRSFFGTHVVRDLENTRIYKNGTTVHGAQRRSELNNDARPTPLYYYHPDGPMAQVMTSVTGKAAANVGVVGLGVGSLSCYGEPGQRWQFYEIDAMVDRVARDPLLFTFMSQCAPDAPTHIGDARVVLDQQTSARFDILVIDAYSSDAVPVHLTTNQALHLYRNRIKPGGIIMFHISNRYYDISRPLGRSAKDLGLSALIQTYRGATTDPTNSPSTVVIMSDHAASLTPFRVDARWSVLQSDAGRIWTDDYANLLSILD